MRRFKVLAGTHIQESRTYKKGDIVHSDQDLAVLFKGKFEEVHERPARRAPAAKAADEDWDKPAEAPEGARPVGRATVEDEEEEAEAPSPAPPTGPGARRRTQPRTSTRSRTHKAGEDEEG